MIDPKDLDAIRERVAVSRRVDCNCQRCQDIRALLSHVYELAKQRAIDVEEIRRLNEALKRQGAAALQGMTAAKAISSHQLETARRLHAESSPDALESERQMNAQLTEENGRLRAELSSREFVVYRNCDKHLSIPWTTLAVPAEGVWRAVCPHCEPPK